MDRQIKNVCHSSLFHVKNISSIRALIPQCAVAQLVHSLVTSRMDYGNSLLFGVPAYPLKQLQRIQNIAARVVKYVHSLCRQYIDTTPVLKSLHWLPIKLRIKFKMLLTTYKCVHGLAPNYLCKLTVPKRRSRPLRITSRGYLEIPITGLKYYENRFFSFGAAKEWNKLPLEIRKSPSVELFKKQVKTHLFQQYFN